MSSPELKIELADKQQITVKNNQDFVFLNGEQVEYQLTKKSNTRYLLNYKNKVYSIVLIQSDDGSYIVNVDGQNIELTVKDHIAQILEKLGMETGVVEVVSEIRAPMPGAIIDIMVSEGDELKEGESVLILEAMKMENIIKSPANAVITKVHVQKGDNVEKNHLLISF